ncbi:helix-turn-helix domain-containing protein [[Clostridium] hylemonae]|uniref:helix-turn-helix domain-containing protein n=1 Tax=[Clostridium] hylemonae TaxID=89153 RepID=UPI001106E8B2|nr:helix-turn-helix transcriptional regulator [[Clostridium] hylemonae]
MSAETLGQYLRAVREQHKLSMGNVTKATGITNTRLSHLECDVTRNPSPVALRKLALLYNIKLIELYQKAGYLMPEDTDSYMETCFKGVEKLTQEDKKQIQNQIDYLIFQHEKEREGKQ